MPDQPARPVYRERMTGMVRLAMQTGDPFDHGCQFRGPMFRRILSVNLSLLLSLLLFGCGSSDDSETNSAPSDAAADPDSPALDAASDTVPHDALAEDVAPDDAGLADADASDDAADAALADVAEADAPEAFAFEGIWRKTALGDDLIVENDCGAFWIMDFDYEYTRFERAGDTLTVSYCEDETCAVVDSITETLNVEGNSAVGSDPSTMDVPGCSIQIASSTELTLESDDAGRHRWERGLTYVGGQCDAYKDPAMTGSTCSAVAEAEVVRFE
jgi:hypothetical protein